MHTPLLVQNIKTYKRTYQVTYCQVNLVNIADITATINIFNIGG